jgi:hypothetical protein
MPAPAFSVNARKREELVAANSAWLRERYFEACRAAGVAVVAKEVLPQQGGAAKSLPS